MRPIFISSLQSLVAFATVALLTGANDAGCGVGAPTLDEPIGAANAAAIPSASAIEHCDDNGACVAGPPACPPPPVHLCKDAPCGAPCGMPPSMPGQPPPGYCDEVGVCRPNPPNCGP